jgi:hypothetical protein
MTLPVARKMMDRAERIRLSERDSVRVLELLENPPQPTEALLAAAQRLALDQVASEQAKQATKRHRVTRNRNGLRVIHLQRRTPKVTVALVDQLRDDLP